jgi:hypothetical protein
MALQKQVLPTSIAVMTALYCHAQYRLPGAMLPLPPPCSETEVPGSLSVLASSPQGQMLRKQVQVTALLAEQQWSLPRTLMSRACVGVLS